MRRFSLLVAVLAAACAHVSPFATYTPALDLAKLSQRRALGAIKDPLAHRPDEGTRLARIAELARELGDPEEVEQATRAALRHALAMDAAARVLGMGDAQITRQQLAERTQRCGELARAIRRPQLALYCAQGPAPLDRSVLRWALREAWVTERDKARFRPQVAGDLELEVLLDMEVPARRLAGLGRVGLEALHRRLTGGPDAGAARSLEAAELLHAKDPHHLPARILLHLEEDINRGRLRTTPELRRDLRNLQGFQDAGPSIVRVELASKASPSAKSLALWLAYRLLDRGLYADALQFAQRAIQGGQADRKQQHTAELIMLLSRAASGDRAPADQLMRGPTGASPYVLNELAGWSEVRPLRAQVRAAAERILERGLPRYRALDFTEIAADPTAPDVLRARARAEASRELEPVLRRCAEKRRTVEDCQRRLDAAYLLSDYEGGWTELLSLDPEEVDPAWLSQGLYLSEQDLDPVRAWLARAGLSYLAQTAAYARVQLALLASEADAPSFARVLREVEPQLGPAQRISAALALLDLRNGQKPDLASALGGALQLESRPRILRKDAPLPEWLEQEPAPGLLAAFERGLTLRSHGHAERALSLWEPLLSTLEGDAGALLALATADLAQLSGQADLAARARARLQRLVPDAWPHPLLSAAEQTPSEQGDCLRALSQPLYARALARCVRASAERGASAVVRWQELAAWWEPDALPGSLLAAGVELDAGQLMGLLGSSSEEDLLSLDDARLGRALGDRGVANQLWWTMGLDESAAAERLRAARLSPLFEASPSERERVAWLYWLAGDGARAGRLARAAELRGETPALALLLAPEVRANLSDELALQLFRVTARGAFRAGDPDPELVHALRTLSPRTRALDELACIMLDEPDAGLEVCGSAFNQGSRAPQVVVRYSALISEHDGTARGVDASSMFTEAQRRFGRELPGEVWHNEAVRLMRLGRTRAAAEAEAHAWVRGYAPNQPTDDDLDQARYRPLSARLLAGQAAWGPARFTALVWSTLNDGTLEGAELYLRAAFARNVEDLETEALGQLFTTRDIVQLARGDRERGALGADGLAELLAASRHDDFEGLTRVLERHPRSELAQLFHAEELPQRGRLDEALARLEALHASHPRMATLAVDRASYLARRGQFRQARELIAAAKLHEPRDPRLANVQVPERADGAENPVAPVFASPDALRGALAAVTEAQLAELEPALRSHVEVGAELALGAAYGPHPRFPLGGQHEGMSVGVMVVPRASRCQPLQCLEPVNAGYEQVGLRVGWKRDWELPLGPAAASLVHGPDTLLFTVAFPVGERTYVLAVGGSAPRVQAELAAVRLALESLRPLDAVVSAQAAEVLRSRSERRNGYFTQTHPVADDLRLAARRAALRAGIPGGCPVHEQLKSLPAEDRAWLLLDVYLVTPGADARRALMDCASSAADKAQLGLVALWDEEPGIHDLGASHVRDAPAAAVDQFRRLLPVMNGRALSARAEESEELPRFGVVELLSALPDEPRKQLSRELLQHGPKGVRPSVLVALALAEDGLDASLWERIASASSSELALLLRAGKRDPEVRARARVRAGSLQIESEEDLAVARVLARYLAAQFDATDRPLLSRLRAQEAARQPESNQGSYSVSFSADLHAAALAPDSLHEHPQRAALRTELAKLRASRGGRLAQARMRAVSERPLADSLPGADWSYYRVARPDLLLAGVESLYERLGSPDNPQRLLALAMLRGLLQRAGSALFEERGGLDLTRPVECAALSHSRQFVCSGYVRDAQAIRRQLARRKPGQDAGLALAMHVGRGAVGLPLAALLTPAILHATVYGTTTAGAGHAASVVTRERARLASTVPGSSLEQMVFIEGREDGAAQVDGEVYLFRGQRWFVFATEELAQWLLGADTKRTLARDPAFRAATRGWKEGGALQAYWADHGAEGASSLELTPQADGLYARLKTPHTQPSSDLGALLHALPDGAVARFADASFKHWKDMLPELRPDPRAGPVPHYELFAGASAVAFGWYVKPTDPLWAHWVAVVDREGLLPEAIRSSPLHAARSGSLWVVASEPDLLSQTLARLSRPDRNRARPILGSGSLDGARAGAFIAQLADGQPLMNSVAMGLRGIGALVSMVRELSFEWSARGHVRTLEARLLPELSGNVQSDRVLNAWLGGARRMRNAMQLPAVVRSDWLERGLRVRLRSESSRAALLRAFPASPRVEASSLSDGDVEIRVRPGPRLNEPGHRLRYEAAELAGMLASDAQIRPDHERIAALAREITAGAPDAPSKVAAVLAWVGRHLRYELNPSMADALSILESRRGDCTEFAVLTVSLLRAAGIPAQIRSGLMLQDTELVAHAWVSYFDGHGFREVDPTSQRRTVHAGYIEASILDLAALLSLDEVRVVEVKPLE